MASAGGAGIDSPEPISKPADKATILESQGYQLSKTLGQGSYAVVKGAYSTKHRAQVAIKIISKKKAPQDFLEKFLPREIEVVKVLKHKNIICFLQSIETTNRVYLIMEIAPHGDLLDVIRKHRHIKEPQAALWFSQITEAVSYCHEKGVVHRDLKCENVLLDRKHNIKITDFGFARSDVRKEGQKILSETYCGSYAYAAPEILKGTPYEPHFADIWSMGIILFTMVYGRLPYDDSDHRVLLKQVQSPVNFPDKVETTAECRALISKILMHRTHRITIDQIRTDEWLVKHFENRKTEGADKRGSSPVLPGEPGEPGEPTPETSSGQRQ